MQYCLIRQKTDLYFNGRSEVHLANSPLTLGRRTSARRVKPVDRDRQDRCLYVPSKSRRSENLGHECNRNQQHRGCFIGIMSFLKTRTAVARPITFGGVRI